MSSIKSGLACLLSDRHGIYIPAKFIECYTPEQWGVTADDQKELSSPDNEWYWDTWERVLNNAAYTGEDGNKWYLYHDGDLYAVCYELLTDEEKEFIGIEEDNRNFPAAPEQKCYVL